MRRSFSILIWILLGALAASLGIGSVLLDAKQDRALLEAQINAQNQHILQLQTEHTTLVEQANTAVAAATRNASATRDVLNTVLAEQIALDKARLLVSSAQYRWLETISFPLGLSLKTPPTVRTTSTDHSISSLLASTQETWLSITAADQSRFEGLSGALSQTESVQYRVGTTLLSGVRGQMADGRRVYVLQTQSHGKPGFLIWAKAMGNVSEAILLDSLASLRFAAR